MRSADRVMGLVPRAFRYCNSAVVAVSASLPPDVAFWGNGLGSMWAFEVGGRRHAYIYITTRIHEWRWNGDGDGHGYGDGDGHDT